MTDSLVTWQDVWGNPKVPYLRGDANATTGSAAWMVLDEDTSSSSSTSSLVGIIVSDVANDTDTVFNMTTSYLSMQCQQPKTFTYSPPDTFSSQNGTDLPTNMSGYQDFIDWSGPLIYQDLLYGNESAENSTTIVYKQYNEWQYLIDVKSNGTDNSTGSRTFDKPPHFVHATQSAGVVEDLSVIVITAYDCVSAIVWAEVSMNCSDGPYSCEATKIRRVQQPSDEPEHALIGSQENLPQLLAVLDGYNNFQQIGAVFYAGYSSIPLFMAGQSPFPSDPYQATADYSTVATSDIAYRLAKLVNTAWLASLQFTSLAQPTITNSTQLDNADPRSTNYLTDSTGYIGYNVVPVHAETLTLVPIYQTNWKWVTIAMIISIGLLVLGFVGIYFRHNNKQPDVLGYVSTLTRDNPDFVPPLGAERLDGLEMASYYKHMRVKLVKTAEDSDEQSQVTLRQYH